MPDPLFVRNSDCGIYASANHMDVGTQGVEADGEGTAEEQWAEGSDSNTRF